MSRFILHKHAWYRILGWLAEPTLLWAFVGGIVLASFVGDWIGFALDSMREDKIRYAGWLLEIFGLSTVAIGLSKKLDLFHGKNVWTLFGEATMRWLCRFPLLRQDKNIVVGTVDLKLGPMRAQAYASVKIDPNKPVDEKINWLLERHYELVNTVHRVQKKIEKNEGEFERQLQALRRVLEKTIGKVEAQTAKAHVGEIGGEFVGLGWILCGVTFATTPEFIESWFWWLIEFFEFLGDLLT